MDVFANIVAVLGAAAGMATLLLASVKLAERIPLPAMDPTVQRTFRVVFGVLIDLVLIVGALLIWVSSRI